MNYGSDNTTINAPYLLQKFRASASSRGKKAKGKNPRMVWIFQIAMKLTFHSTQKALCMWSCTVVTREPVSTVGAGFVEGWRGRWERKTTWLDVHQRAKNLQGIYLKCSRATLFNTISSERVPREAVFATPHTSSRFSPKQTGQVKQTWCPGAVSAASPIALFLLDFNGSISQNGVIQRKSPFKHS